MKQRSRKGKLTIAIETYQAESEASAARVVAILDACTDTFNANLEIRSLGIQLSK